MLGVLGFYFKTPEPLLEASEHFPFHPLPLRWKLSVIDQVLLQRTSGMDYRQLQLLLPSHPGNCWAFPAIPGNCWDFSAFYSCTRVRVLWLQLGLFCNWCCMVILSPGWQTHGFTWLDHSCPALTCSILVPYMNCLHPSWPIEFVRWRQMWIWFSCGKKCKLMSPCPSVILRFFPSHLKEGGKRDLRKSKK